MMGDYPNSVVRNLGKGAIYALDMLEQPLGLSIKELHKYFKRQRRIGQVRYIRLTKYLAYIKYLKETNYNDAKEWCCPECHGDIKHILGGQVWNKNYKWACLNPSCKFYQEWEITYLKEHWIDGVSNVKSYGTAPITKLSLL